MIKRLISSYLLIGLLGFSQLAEAAISISIDRKPVRVNESFQLFFESEQTPDQDPDFSPLQKDFVILSSSQSHNISIINGEYRRSLKWTLLLMPKEVGEFIVPGVHFGKDQSKSFKIEVKSAGQNSAPADGDLIFELSADKATIPVQGQVVVKLRLLTNLNVSAYQMHDLEIDGVEVVIEPLGRTRQYQTQLGGKPFLVREKKFALFPQQSGQLKIKPVLAEIRLTSRAQTLFNPFPESGNLRRILSQGLTLEITSVSDTFDAPNWLPATSIRLVEKWQGDLNRIIVGEPVTRTISLVAQGLTAAQLPDLVVKDIAGVKQYPDKPLLQNQRTTMGIIGTREQKIALIPTVAGSFILPEIAVPWWNVDTQRQEVALIPSRTINVSPATFKVPVLLPNFDPFPASAIDSLLLTKANTKTGSFWVWVSLFLAIGWMVSIAVWWISRGRFTRSGPAATVATSTSLRKAKRRLNRACTDHNAREAMEALLEWARCFEPDRRFVRLSQIAQYFGEPLGQHIDRLNENLYSQSKIEWDGKDLWQACVSISSSQKERAGKEVDTRLQPLNP